MPFGGFGIWEVMLVLLVILLVVGPRRLPELGGALGQGIRQFKGSLKEVENELDLPDNTPKELDGGVAPSTASREPRPAGKDASPSA